MRCIVIFIMLFTSSTIHSQSPLFPNLSGDDLLYEIVNNYKPPIVLSYDHARDVMYSEIYNKNDSVSCVYSGHQLFLPEGIDPSTFLWMDGAPNGINTEHTYPRAKGAANGNANSDMHHLFPTRAKVNNSRDTFPFGEIEDDQTATWFYLNQSQSNTPASNIDLYSEQIYRRFEPREQHKGNAARAVFYFYTMYKNKALDADPVFFETQRATLCDWHLQDPVDSLEWERTFMIAAYQSDLPNPFVIDVSLPSRTFCGGDISTAIHEQASPEILVFPNPVVDWVQIISADESTLQVIDILGRIFIEKQFSDSTKIDFSLLDAGHYFISINGGVFRIVKL